MPRFAPVSSRASFAEAERGLLDLWRRNQVFARGLALRQGRPQYVFNEGPPTANAAPGFHHVLARAYKDLFPRYRQMDGYSVQRKAGWDTHGLPVELQIERRLGISGKRQIEDFGVAEFNRLCRESVSEYIGEWERMTERLGFWLDLENAYRTFDSTYIESVWWSLKQVWDRGLLDQGYKVVPYCPRCQTSLSSHELSQGYKDGIEDPSVYVKFALEDAEGDLSLLAWTTTPWTLPGNVALAVHPEVTYVRVRQPGHEDLVVARERLDAIVGDHEVVEEMRGADLVGRSYRPLFTDMLPEGKAFVVLAAPELVSTDEGTGIVHTAAAYGEADLELCQREGVAVRHVVGLDGRFLDGQTRYRGMFVKDADPQIIEDLRAEGRLYRSERVLHTYPFCWRCDTPLIYYALTSWFIRTTVVRDQLIRNNRQVDWQPAHIRDGRMGNWLENLVDWNLSRSRYWGTPLPIWVCEQCQAQQCAGSAADVGLTVADDLHKPHIDEVTLTCECGGVMRRVPEVIDCWYDSGAMPFAQWHYPFENRELFESRHPADFICEAIDQTRGWFFTLLAESTLLFDQPAYRHCVCLGHVVDVTGRKHSKSRGNLIDPWTLFDDYGADAVRWYFYSSVSAGQQYRVSEDAVQEVVRRFLLTLWNVYKFFCDYAEVDGWDPSAPAPGVLQRPALDRWVLARLAATIDDVRGALDRYDATDACRDIEALVEDVSKWYVRRSRRRFWKSVDDAGAGDDKAAAYATLYTVLESVARLVAPFMPFVAERIYRNLHGFEGDAAPAEGVADSVHLADYPRTEGVMRDADLLAEMARCRRLVESGLAARETAGIKVRQPLRAAVIRGAALPAALEEILADELNVKTVAYAEREGTHDEVELDTDIDDDLRLEGVARDVSRKVNDLRKQAGLALTDRITLRADGDPDVLRAVEAHRDTLLRDTLAVAIVAGRDGDGCLAAWEGRLAGMTAWLGISR